MTSILTCFAICFTLYIVAHLSFVIACCNAAMPPEELLLPRGWPPVGYAQRQRVAKLANLTLASHKVVWRDAHLARSKF